MELKLTLNGRAVSASEEADTLLKEIHRAQGCQRVKRGCETANCGLCTVLMDGTPVLSCSVLVLRAAGHHGQTLEGLHEACPEHSGDWYFSGDYPTPGGVKLVNRAFISYYENVFKANK